MEELMSTFKIFELLVSQAPQTGEEQLLGYFFVGLQSKIRNQIRSNDPKN